MNIPVPSPSSLLTAWLLWSATPGFGDSSTFRRTFLLAASSAAWWRSRFTAAITILNWAAASGHRLGNCFARDALAPENRGSPYVPLDSWVYPALDRLAGFGLIDSAFAGDRPWTRRECARLLSESEELMAGGDDQNSQAQGLITELEREFRPELQPTDENDGGAFRVESLYSRTEYISGLPIRDGYHFAQTQINDFGRPYGKGWNTVNGFSTYSTWGRWVGYFRGEWQASSGLPALSLAARQTIRAGRPPDASAAGRWPTDDKSVPGARCLCRLGLLKLAVDLWPPEPMVGAGRRRAADSERQRRTAQHVPH